MKNMIKVSLIASMFLGAAHLNADNISDMFKDGKVSGQVRLGYIDNNAAVSTNVDTHATAIGGQLKYETASLMGVSLGAAMYTSHTIHDLSGKNNKFNDSLASSEKSYTELAEAYVNYSRDGFNLRAGRQLIDTPLADSDDIAMTPHTFEAYVASYEFKDLGLTLIGANVQRWQGTDSGYENVLQNSWQDTGANGTWMAAALYTNDNIELGAWYYDVTKNAKAVYADATVAFDLGSGANLTVGAQHLSESESNTVAGTPSGIDGSISGVMAEAAHMGITIYLAHDRVSVDNGKQIFEGFGGGSSYTNMDTMTAGTLHDGTHGDGKSYVASIGYDIAGVNLFAAYGDYKADAGTSAKAHVTELDVGLTYEYNDGEADISIIYVDGTDKESSTKTEFDDSHIQITANYNF